MPRGLRDIEPILSEAKRILQRVYGDRLRGVILYGSYARGEASEDSDIDLIVLLKDMGDPLDELEKVFGEIHRLDLKYDTLISIIPFDAGEYDRRSLPIILNAKREGVLI